MNFLNELKKRNALLYWFGWYNLLCGIICLLLLALDHTAILGINRWIKPVKFFLSVGIMIWTMAWILYYLNSKKVKAISWLFVITMFFENAIITMQAARGVRSHFNVSSALNGMLFSIMGLLIVLFTVVTIYVLVLFFR